MTGAQASNTSTNVKIGTALPHRSPRLGGVSCLRYFAFVIAWQLLYRGKVQIFNVMYRNSAKPE
jgi:hypothetical protein